MMGEADEVAAVFPTIFIIFYLDKTTTMISQTVSQSVSQFYSDTLN